MPVFKLYTFFAWDKGKVKSTLHFQCIEYLVWTAIELIIIFPQTRRQCQWHVKSAVMPEVKPIVASLTALSNAKQVQIWVQTEISSTLIRLTYILFKYGSFKMCFNWIFKAFIYRYDKQTVPKMPAFVDALRMDCKITSRKLHISTPNFRLVFRCTCTFVFTSSTRRISKKHWQIIVIKKHFSGSSKVSRASSSCRFHYIFTVLRMFSDYCLIQEQ